MLLFCCHKTHQGNLWKKEFAWAYSSRGLWVHHSRRCDGWNRKLRVLNHDHEAESRTRSGTNPKAQWHKPPEMALVSKPNASDILPVPPNQLKQTRDHPLGTKYSNTQAYEENSYSNHYKFIADLLDLKKKKSVGAQTPAALAISVVCVWFW